MKCDTLIQEMRVYAFRGWVHVKFAGNPLKNKMPPARVSGLNNKQIPHAARGFGMTPDNHPPQRRRVNIRGQAGQGEKELIIVY